MFAVLRFNSSKPSVKVIYVGSSMATKRVSIKLKTLLPMQLNLAIFAVIFPLYFTKESVHL